MPSYTIDSLRAAVANASSKPSRRYFSLTAQQGVELLAQIDKAQPPKPEPTLRCFGDRHIQIILPGFRLAVDNARVPDMIAAIGALRSVLTDPVKLADAVLSIADAWYTP
jgi:hypothetical protein